MWGFTRGNRGQEAEGRGQGKVKDVKGCVVGIVEFCMPYSVSCLLEDLVPFDNDKADVVFGFGKCEQIGFDSVEDFFRG